MLGELIYEATGKVTGMRVFDVENGLPKVETTISQNANLRGREASLIVTYVSVPSEVFPNSDEGSTILHAKGQGLLMLKNSNEIATWTGEGIARVTGQKREDRGSVFCKTTSKGHLAFLDNLVGVFEYTANLTDGTAEGKVWEWK